MSFKRGAGTDLNHDNWNEEEEREEAGEFKKAQEEILAQRPRKLAKRRIAATSNDESGAPASNPFSGFGGFGQKGSIVSSTPSPFSFLSKLPAAPINENKTNGEVTKPVSTETPFKMSTTALSSSPFANKNDSNNNTEYYSKVKSLNVAFTDWIKSNIDETKGLCDLTPIFKDYEKYMKECQQLKEKIISSKPAITEEKKEPQASFTFGKPATTNNTSISSSPSSGIFGSFNKTSTTKEASPIKPAENKPFSFGLGPASSTTSSLSAAPSFSFGLQKTSTAINSNPAAPIFGNLSSASSTPFSFSNVTQNSTVANTAGTSNEEEAEEEPPKNEFVPVVEEDSLYSKRCKVFVKSGSDYADRGIGTLFLKKVDDKVQLIVRADTNLGNILLNIIICDGLPTSRLGKNNVMIVCCPTPESKPPPIPVLVRVKTSDEADELLATLEKYKK